MRIPRLLTPVSWLGVWLGLLGIAMAAASEGMDPLRVIERLQERIAACRDYQYEVVSYERLGAREERRSYRLFVKDSRLVRVRVTAGRGKGSEAAIDGKGRIRGRESGLLKSFDRGLKPEDRRLRSLRGQPFWECAAHNFLPSLRQRMTRPGVQCSLEKATDEPGHLVLEVRQPNSNWERYWIETPALRLARGEVGEGGQIVSRFEIRDLRENVGLTDGFFSF